MAVVVGGDPIVRLVLVQLEKGASSKMIDKLAKSGLPNAGRYIGYLERALVYLLVMYQQPQAIVFIIGAKAIIRFENSKDRAFAEYFLVGTFTSILIALGVAGIILGPTVGKP